MLNQAGAVPKKQLATALGGAIGVTAATIAWEAIFSAGHGALGSRFAAWMGFAILAASITFAWTWGARCQPQQTAQFGALTGAIVAAPLNWIFDSTISSSIGARIDLTIFDMFQFGFYGFFGGLAIERKWGRYAALGVALGVVIAGVLSTFLQAFFIDATAPNGPGTPLASGVRVFSDSGFWIYEISRHFSMALGWALALALLPKVYNPFQRDEAYHAGDDAKLSQGGASKTPPLRDQVETALTATIGVCAALILWDAIFLRGMFAWNQDTLRFLLSIAFSVWLSFRYLDPFLERVRGDDEQGLEAHARLRKISLLTVSVMVPVGIFMQVHDKVMTDNPTSGAVYWIVAALSGGAITLAWARGVCRVPKRTAEFGALCGAIVLTVVHLVVLAYARIHGFQRTTDQTIMVITSGILEWGLYGLFGGLAVERRLFMWLPLRVGVGIGTAGLIVALGVGTAEFGLFNLFNSGRVFDWVAVLSRVLFVTVGWVWGLMLFAKTDQILSPHGDDQAPGYIVPSE